ncbi:MULTISPECIES: phospholipase A [unclassified Simplicispira]|uniref:phospholipase A n=1 Tax=unclassified Simplicispira TaxID=2630407 RepID=UPI000D5E6611|nr:MULTISPECIES: phospholipase A [unclassified Simplicispira]PVY57018.1 phospholipase A1 [Simplicispira sp. 125]REG17963.1 phospholipase A1 [Simplicispira sp. 110]
MPSLAYPLKASPVALALVALLANPAAQAQVPSAAWQRCAATSDSAARLACFDQWAGQQAWQAPAASAAQDDPPAAPSLVDTTLPATRIIEVAQTAGCRDPQYSTLSRFWELESGSDCGTFSFRGYRPITASVVAASNVNRQPGSPSADHTAQESTPFRRTEARLQLSVRTKIAQGLLTQGHPTRKDSLWFGYTQQSYWQLFSPQISRPFRTTDHEPEVMYVYPTDAQLPWGWRWRFSGIGVAHQSNGQSLPLSRSWNRAYLMTGMELDNRWTVNARLWKRIGESTTSDDNPGISDFVGRGELSAFWNMDQGNTLGLTVRSALKSNSRGSARIEWMQTLGTALGGGKSNLRLHTQLFSGYGDSMIDYNRKRTVFTVGLSLVDF